MREFYDCARAYRARHEAYQWISSDWDALDSETHDSLAVPGRVTSADVAMDIRSTLNVSSLVSTPTIFRVDGGTATALLSDILAVIPNRKWLTDTPVSLLLQKLCAEHGNAYCVSSLVHSTTTWRIPRDRAWRYFGVACNVSQCHWTLALIDTVSWKVTIYDPMESKNFTSLTKERLISVVFPAITDWYESRFKNDPKNTVIEGGKCRSFRRKNRKFFVDRDKEIAIVVVF